MAPLVEQLEGGPSRGLLAVKRKGGEMSYKTILVCLTTEQAAERILPASCRLARAFGAHLIGVHTLEALVLYPGIFLPGHRATL